MTPDTRKRRGRPTGGTPVPPPKLPLPAGCSCLVASFLGRLERFADAGCPVHRSRS